MLVTIVMLLAIAPGVKAASSMEAPSPWVIYIPITMNGQSLPDAPQIAIPYINVSADAMNDHTGELSLFWFGQVRLAENYTDVRMGYNNDELFIRMHVFDRRCWFDETEPLDQPTKWDAGAIYLNLDGNTGTTPSTNSYQFLVQFDAFPTWNPPWETNTIAYKGNGSIWQPVNIPFTMTSSYTGGIPNDDGDDRGWTVIIRIPFSSLGLSSKPAASTTWGIAAVNYDRDDANGTAITPKVWPSNVNLGKPNTWAQVRFGLPASTAVGDPVVGTTLIRQGLNGAIVSDASAGGYSVCGGGTDFWSSWGDTNEGFYSEERSDFNIQNQGNVADWPCFSKVYIKFPMDQVPAGKRILSATLTMYVWGHAGDINYDTPSLVHVYSVSNDWNEQTITWNNAPYIDTYISQNWVSAPPPNTGFPGIANSWDVTSAVQSAYTSGQMVNLVLYSSDNWMDSGKYIVSSNTGDWNAAGRPILTVKWGN